MEPTPFDGLCCDSILCLLTQAESLIGSDVHSLSTDDHFQLDPSGQFLIMVLEVSNDTSVHRLKVHCGVGRQEGNPCAF